MACAESLALRPGLPPCLGAVAPVNCFMCCSRSLRCCASLSSRGAATLSIWPLVRVKRIVPGGIDATIGRYGYNINYWWAQAETNR